MTYTLQLQWPKPNTIGSGSLSVDADGVARFFQSGRLVADMEKVTIEFIRNDSIMLTGLEHDGFDKQGRKQLSVQEWWLRLTPEVTEHRSCSTAAASKSRRKVHGIARSIKRE
jgi:hypothetical protein